MAQLNRLCWQARRITLAKSDEIRSTEKLLQLIRDQDQDIAPPAANTTTPRVETEGKTSLFSAITFQKKITIGVDIGHTYIKMAKIHQLPDKSYELLDYTDLSLNAPLSLSEPKQLNLLKSTLEKFRGEDNHCDIWSAITSANVETRCIRIPKLPRKQVHNAIFWTFTKKVSFNEKAEVLDYEIAGDVTEGGVKKTEVMTFKGPREEISSLKTAFQEIGFPLKGISIVPFAIQNLFRTRVITHQEQDVCSLFIGRDWSRIAIFSDGNLVLSRGIKAGMRSMVEAINIALQNEDNWNTPPPNHSQQTLNDVEHTAAINPYAQKLFFELIKTPGAKRVDSKDNQLLDNAKVFQMVLPAMERLIRQVERTFEHYALNFHREGVRRIYISGQITANTMIVQHIGKQLDLPIEVMNPFSHQVFARNVPTPADAVEREGYVPAIGLALSSNSRTPNFLFTHQDKDQIEQVRRNNMRMLTACMLILMILIGIFSWQEKRLDAKRDQIEKLNVQLSAYNPPADKQILLALYSQTKHKREALNKIVHRYATVAIMDELAQITPAGIRLIKVQTIFANKSSKTSGDKSNTLSVEGIIFGQADGLETALTSYMFSLRNSPLFRKPAVQNKRIEYYNSQEVLRFNVHLEII